ncbi:MAG TPA: hypothetical protein VF637_15350 [Sphingomicrobium sp.]|jgi:hypothetical protein
MVATFADDMVEELLLRTERGEPLTRICTDSNMPSRASVYSWIESDEQFAGRFRAARARGVHALAEECLTIADEPTNDPVQVANKRVRIDTRLRLAGKWLPKEYGDKLDVNYNAEVTHRHDLTGYTADELDTLEKLVGKTPDVARDPGGESPQKPSRLH